MLHTPLWKRLTTLVVVVFLLTMAMPNLFYARVERHNDALQAVARSGVAPDAETQAALDLWPGFLPNGLVNLGLDLRGGAHLLAEVQLAEVYKSRMDSLWPQAREALKDIRDQVGAIRRAPSEPAELRITLSNPAGAPAAIAAIEALNAPILSLTGVGQSTYEVTDEAGTIVVRLSEAGRIEIDRQTMDTSLTVIRRRVDQAGTREPSILRQGADRILIEVPGVGSAQELKDIIGTTAKLTFNQVLGRVSDADAPVEPRQLVLPSAEEEGVFYIVDEAPVVTGDDLTNAQPSFDQNNRPAVSFQFNVAGARLFGDYTAEHIGEPFAIVLDGKVISAPTIQSHIGGGSGIITGRFSVEESTNLAVLLRAGALPASMQFLEERTIGPELGQDSIDAGRVAAVAAIVLVGLFMLASYGLFGVFANLALAINIGLLFGCLSMVGSTLTLPGIAGVVLTIGMAVDANVLVFERIREELRLAKTPARAIELGYERAFSAILDANVTTIITAAVLFYFGAGPVRGFAVTLFFGILTSVFCAMFVTRAIIELWFNGLRPKTVVV